MSVTCDFCNNSYTNKYILKNHLDTNKKCLLLQGKQDNTSISRICEACQEFFTTKGNLIKHQKCCKVYLMKQKVEQIEKEKELLQQLLDKNAYLFDMEKKYISLQLEMKTLIENHHVEIIQLNLVNDSNKKQFEKQMEIITTTYNTEIHIIKVGYDSKIQQLEKQINDMNTIIKTTFSESINKPTTTTVHQNTQNISFRDCLSKDHTVDRLNESHLVERLRISMTEKMFFGGLRDIARLCYDYIIKLKDGKMILCCTDVSRGKFKMYDLHGNIKEDIEARYFTEKVGKSLKVAGTEIYNCIMQSIEDEKSTLTETDFKRKEELLDKFKRTCDAYIEIINVDDPERNNEFINELAALTAIHAINTPLEPNTNPKRLVY